mmetsp:Transcript_13384/g.19271  ORF Transcript_13384/g.19271 Transcript_13384/m.19271 type:complete len:273 (+) Transcript_13384:634-1452(+)
MRQMKYELDFSAEFFEPIRIDTMVSDLLTSNPRILNSFGHCGITTFSEFMYGYDLGRNLMGPKAAEGEYYDADLDSIEKLTIIAEIAKGLAELHGYRGGPIVHGNLSLAQVLVDDTGYLKLADFSQAEMLLWDEEDQNYCRYMGGEYVTTKSPEEYMGQPIDESADIFSFGALVYAVLTGAYLYSDVHPIYSERDYQHVVTDVQNVASAIGWQNPEEDKLLELLHASTHFDRKERPTIFEIVSFLQDALTAAEDKLRERVASLDADELRRRR